jgi:uroporphyrinogen decarboxylase
LVDVRFVEFPPGPAAAKLDRLQEIYPLDTRLGSPAQVTTYERWEYRPEDPKLRNPLARASSIDDLKAFSFPDPSDPSHVEEVARQVEDLHARGLAAGGNPPHLGGELFETAWRLRGLENFLLDLVERPDWADLLLDRLTEHARDHAVTLARTGVDVLALDDDVGMPGTMMISPATWRRFFKHRMAEIIEAARAVHPDLCVLYHSDGHFEPILGDLIEIGVHAINPLQPEHMDAARIRKRFGPKLALWGTVGRQTTFSFARPEEIRREVKERVESLGRAGLILCPAYDIDEPDIPWENIAAFLQAVEQYG